MAVTSQPAHRILDAVGEIPYRLALAGGWIDQPFCSRLNPAPPGSMVVVGVKPTFHWMERSGLATGTRAVIRGLWGSLPRRPPEQLVEELYLAENRDKAEPSGTQDMIGLIYPGVSRLDYDFAYRGGIYPKHVETNRDPIVARWLERVLHVLPVGARPEGYNPLIEKNLDPKWIQRLGQTGKDCYDAILNSDLKALGASFNTCMACWEAILPCTVRHPAVQVDLLGLLRHYQANHAGAMYSGCGGGYLFVVSEEPVPGSFHVEIRLE
jgi:hypothetical protein